MDVKTEILGVKETQEAFRRIMTDSPGMDKRLRAAIRKILGEVQRKLQEDASSGLRMNSDPRQAYKAVRRSVYKRIFGGNVSILSSNRAGASTGYFAPRSGHTGRGGNRWGRSADTIRMQGYGGSSRGMILRYLNEGTHNGDRHITSYTDRTGARHDLRSGYGNRGYIAARNWFGRKSEAELEKVAVKIDSIINEILKGEFF